MKKLIGLVKRTMTIVLSLFVCLSFSAQAQNLVPYDSFNGTFINPSKWSTFPGGCPSFSVLDCVREIQNTQLRLAVRSYGATNSGFLVRQLRQKELDSREPSE